MDFKRLAQVLLQRLAPVYVATVLWSVTGYFAFMLGGVALSIALEVTWPLLRPQPKTVYARRTIPVPEGCLAALRHQRAQQAEEKLRLGQGATQTMA